MATSSEIREVQEMLGPDAGAGGWTDIRIGQDLDNGKTPYKIALAWWGYRAANTVSLVNVSESGSSRSIGDIHTHAVQMRALYQGLVDKEDAVPVVVDTGYGKGIRTFSIRRPTA